MIDESAARLVAEGSLMAVLQAARRDFAALGSARAVLIVVRSAVAMDDMLGCVNVCVDVGERNCTCGGWLLGVP